MRYLILGLAIAAASSTACVRAQAQSQPPAMAFAPDVPPATGRRAPAIVHVDLSSTITEIALPNGARYKAWTFNNHAPGPFLRARVGDTLEVTITNNDPSGMPHNLDFHAVSGPGGGGAVTTVAGGAKTTARFKLLYPGLFVYHCGAAPVMVHLANGMYGLLLVEPEEGLPPVDHEFYVMQSEFYTTAPKPGSPLVEYSHQDGLDENPRYILFNADSPMINDNALCANAGERVRFYFGNAGPNKPSSFHVVGSVMDKVYREGDLISPPARGLQTTLVPAGGAAVVEMVPQVPGMYAFLDHAIFRIEKGAMGMLKVEGAARPDIYEGKTTPLGEHMSHH